MPYLRAAEEILKNLSEENIQITLTSIYNNDYYADDFLYSKTLSLFLYMLEVYDLAFVTEEEERIILTRHGEKILFRLNSLLY